MLYGHVKYFVFGSGAFIIDLHTLCRWASFVGTEERQLTHGEPAKYKRPSIRVLEQISDPLEKWLTQRCESCRISVFWKGWLDCWRTNMYLLALLWMDAAIAACTTSWTGAGIDASVVRPLTLGDAVLAWTPNSLSVVQSHNSVGCAPTVLDLEQQASYLLSTAPSTHWPKVWENINEPFLRNQIRPTWYLVLQDVTPIQIHFCKIHLQMSQVSVVQKQIHRYVIQLVWGGLSSLAMDQNNRIAMTLRTVIRHIPMWLLLPNFYTGLDRNIMSSYGFWQIWCNTS
jgi:hypothetical protein